MVASSRVEEFIAAHRLPGSFRATIANAYAPLATWIANRQWPTRPAMLGINGAQGSGKTTLAAYLDLALSDVFGWKIAPLSIDDFYLTKAEREALAVTVHPLLATRGVPGTHDMRMLDDCLRALASLGPAEQLRLPRFDKARDDRAAEATWPVVTGPLDLVILEGWCVGSVAQPGADLEPPVNELERDRDPQGAWRRYANDRLGRDYAAVFARLDALVFLHVPGFEAIRRWRLEQEHKLRTAAPGGAPAAMDDRQVEEFMQHFERITRHNLTTVRSNADIVLELDEYHQCVASHYRDIA